jgi:drug/metabolite transporter (DMT)-like permease
MFGDRLTPALLIGGALIVVGSLVVVLGEGRPEAVTPA